MKKITALELQNHFVDADNKLKELYRLSIISEVSRRSGCILFVDDMEEQVTVFQSLLKKKGISNIPIVLTDCVDGAKKEITTRGIDGIKVIIIDLQLRGSDGRDLIKWLEEHHSELPFIVSTGHPELIEQLEREYSSTEVFLKGNTRIDEYARALGLDDGSVVDETIPIDSSL